MSDTCDTLCAESSMRRVLLLLLLLLQAGWSECHCGRGLHCVEVAPQAQSSEGEYSRFSGGGGCR